jgi:HD-like signal output (HDOD) protein
MIEEIAKKVDALPPLPRTVIELQEFKNQGTQEVSQLVTILEKDPLIMATLLKIANSAMFGFRNKVETIKKTVELIGINFTLSIAFGSAIKSNLNTDLTCYTIDTDKFLELSGLRLNFLHKWLNGNDQKLLNELLLPAFLQNAGEFIIAEMANELHLKEQFLADIKSNPSEISKYEKKYFEASATKITAMIFKRWKLDDKLVTFIDNIDDLQAEENPNLVHSQVLQIASLLSNPIDPFNDNCVEKALKLAKAYNLNITSLEKSIETMQDLLLDA